MSTITTRLLKWYGSHARRLPWREQRDPYRIWISEIMLQQTRLETVIPYYENWMRAFPTLETLAAASQQDVLAVWEGLGYYSRARNLHRAAQKIVHEYGGELPRHPAALRRLPGVGRYTAAAIASIAFGVDVAVLDANVRRVLSRLFDVSEPADSSSGRLILEALAEKHLPSGRAGDYNQALMDLGAIICTPRLPSCKQCPLQSLCRARARGTQAERPVLRGKPTLPHLNVTAAIIQSAGRVLIALRPSNGLLGGLWEFPGGRQEPGEELTACLQREIQEELGVLVEVGALQAVYRHAYTHFRFTLHAYYCRLLQGEPQPLQASQVRWVTVAELSNFPMGKVDRQIARRLMMVENEKA